jgi:hypothetical protein
VGDAALFQIAAAGIAMEHIAVTTAVVTEHVHRTACSARVLKSVVQITAIRLVSVAKASFRSLQKRE